MSSRFPVPPKASDRPPERLLAVMLGRNTRPETALPAASGAETADMVCVPLSALTAALLAEVQPDRVLTPLFSGGMDAMAVVERLEELHYGGPITVIGPVLPRPALVEAELRALGPGARLVLISRDDPPPPLQFGAKSR